LTIHEQPKFQLCHFRISVILFSADKH